MADAVEMTGGEAIARMLRAHAAGPIFGMGGFQLLPFYDAARRLGLTHHLVNDERCGVFAADAYAKVSGRVGLCDATLGPGATNLVTGLVEALNAGTPLVVIIGDTHRLYSWKNMTQESRQTEILRPACKDLLRVEAVERIPELLRRAFATDRQGWEIMPDHVFTDEALSGMGVDHRPAYPGASWRPSAPPSSPSTSSSWMTCPGCPGMRPRCFGSLDCSSTPGSP
jgi:glyoxylate carboligase